MSRCRQETGAQRRQRIIAKIEANTEFVDPPEGLEHLGPCEIWQGGHSGDGRGGNYPRATIDGQTVAVHRVVATDEFGYLPSKRQVDHLCGRRMCVARRHLEPVTHKENQRRRDKKNGKA